jgi:6-phospho-beta-glucosidase
MKVTVVGGGSTYTPELVEGLALWALRGGATRVCLQDIQQDRLHVIARFCSRMARNLNSNLVVETSADLEEAIQGAGFVVLQIRVGGQRARHEDIRMGLEAGLIGQETVGVGGFAKALRTVPIVLDIARKVRDANPEAWIINFANPSGIVTEAICRFATTRCVGLCNVPKEFQMEVARHMRVEPERVALDWVGLNHLSWARKVLVDGADILPYLLDSLESPHGPKNIPDIQYPKGFLKALRMLPSSYLRYYYMQDVVLEELKLKKKTRAEEVMEIESQLMEYYSNDSNSLKPVLLAERGGAWYSRIAVEVMEALSSEKPSVHIVNTLNLDAIEGVPGDASVEIPATLSSRGVFPQPVGEVEDRIMGLIRQVKAYERMTIEAAMARDEKRGLLALVANPLVPSVGKAVEVMAAVKKRGIL